jgi:hypothetical protein
VHLVAIPRRYIRDVRQWGATSEAFWAAVGSWFETHAEEHGVRAAVTNVGTRQEVRFLHVHLVSESPRWLTGCGSDPADTLAAALRASVAGDGPPGSGSYGVILLPTGWVVGIDGSPAVRQRSQKAT